MRRLTFCSFAFLAAGAIAAQGAAVAAASPHGQQEAEPQVQESASHEDPANEYLQDRYGLSAAEADQRLRRQEAAARLDERLKATHAATYGGLRMDDTDAGTIVVAALGREESFEREARDAGVDRFIVERGTRPLVETERQQQRVVRALAGLRVGVSIDLQAGRVVVRVHPGQNRRDVEERLRGEDSPPVAVVEEAGADETASCAVPHCNPPLRGGVEIYSGTTPCTHGFNVRSNSDGLSYVLTAGHCTGSHTYWYAKFADGSPKYVGPTHNSHFPGTDYGLVRVQDVSGWKPGPTLAVWGTWYPLTNNYNYGISASSGSVLGGTICHSGRTSGSDCGMIIELNYTANYAEGQVHGLGVVDFDSKCIRGGDSGGPMWASGKAYGINSGRGERTNGCVGYYQGVNAALSNLNVHLRTTSNP